jgi:dephospho-CoA kinase
MVFGYGSLVATPGFIPSRESHERGYVCDLVGYRRRWDVAMDNSATIPGYKYFADRATGERPAVYVAFLDVAPCDRSAVNGLAFPVTADELAALDRRERNYERAEVTEAISPRPDARVWAFVGSAEARERFEAGARAGTAVVSAEYLRGVEQGFERLGPEEATRFAASTDPPACRELDLIRVDLPG